MRFKRRLDEDGIDEKLVQEIISAHNLDQKRMRNLYERYKAEAEGPTIFKRSPTAFDGFDDPRVQRLDDKVNNRLNNAFDAEIVDTKVGYLFGHPISYTVDKTQQELMQELEEFLLRNNSEDADSECGKMAAICGYAGRLVYFDLDGKERIRNIEPWEVVFIGGEIHEPTYSLYYYTSEGEQYAEFYDDTNTYFFTNDQLTDIKAHMFEYNPLFGMANNKELKADAEKVLALIDAYDRTLSDASNEIEQYRLAYLILKGMGADEDFLEKAKLGGIIELLGEKDEVKYLTKEINDGMIENHLDRLDENIMRFAKSVNFSDESFGGTISGVAMRFKLLALESKCITMERKFVSSLRYQFKVIFSAWAKRKNVSQEDYLKVIFQFKRNLPANLLDEAQTTLQLKGQISEKTRLSLLSFVDDVEFEMREMEDDAIRFGNALDPLDDTDILDFGKEKSDSTEKESENEGTRPCNVCGGSGKVPSLKTGDPIQCPTCKGTGVLQA